MTIVFSRPQHPIFNTGDVFRMEITVTTATTSGVQSQPSVQSIQYAGATNPNTIAGRLSGIILNTPTITPNLPVTPVFSFHTNIRRIPIPTPTSNSTGAFDYTVSIPGVSATTVSLEGNEVVTSAFRNLQSRVAIQAFQRSSTIFTRGSATLPAIDCINTATRTLYTHPGIGDQSVTVFTNNANFYACIREQSTTLEGFSFQFFGGHRPHLVNSSISSQDSLSMNVSVRRGTTTISALTIQFTALQMNPSGNLIDGTMTYIPFTNNTLTTPTFVRNLTYTNATGLQTLGPVLQGDIVNVNFGRNSGTSTVMARRINTFSFEINPDTSMDVLMGSLVTSGGAVTTTLIDQPFDITEPMGRNVAIGAMTTIFNQRAFPASVIPGSSTLILSSLSLPAITTLPLPGAAALSIDNPNLITIVIGLTGNTQPILTTEITVALTNETTTILNDIPFNMPVPGALLSRESAPMEGRGFFIQSMVTNINPAHQNFLLGVREVATFMSFPRIININQQVSFGIFLRTNRAINIQNNNGQIGQVAVVYVNQ
jgi:hypothetical protein